MNRATRTALLGSIEKWKKIAHKDGEDHGVSNCPLCKQFRSLFDCIGCPVWKRTGKRYCKGSPYEDWDAYTGFNSKKVFDDKSKAIAIAELRFLRSLLPKKKKKAKKCN